MKVREFSVRAPVSVIVFVVVVVGLVVVLVGRCRRQANDAVDFLRLKMNFRNLYASAAELKLRLEIMEKK